MTRIVVSLILGWIVSGCSGMTPIASKTDEAKPRFIVKIYTIGMFKVISAASAPVLLFHSRSNVLLPPREEELTKYGRLLAERKVSVIVVTYEPANQSDSELSRQRFESLKDTLSKAGMPGEQIGHAFTDEFPGIGTCPHYNDCADLFIIVGLAGPQAPDAE